MNDEGIKYIKDIMQSANINFLMGSGLSMPFLKTLGNIERNLTAISEIKDIDESVRLYITNSLFYLYFKDVMYNNKCIIGNCEAADKITTCNNYYDFLKIFNSLLQRRGSTILNKQVNIFTTNIDLFFEKALEELELEFNDGFSGRLSPVFSLSNYNKVLSKRSLHFNNESKIPVFNLLKIHGSLNWKFTEDNKITYSYELDVLDDLEELSKNCNFLEIEANVEIDDLISIGVLQKDCEGIKDRQIKKFQQKYDEIPVVNPTKAKFKETVLDLNYYELLRFYSNELEKENSVLFVLGFSFADEHIAEITLRLAKSNPTLTILIFAYDDDSKSDIQKNLKNTDQRNIKIYTPDAPSTFDFATLNTMIFNPILEKIKKNE